MLVGGRGNLSLALQQVYEGQNLRIIGRDTAYKWTTQDAENQIHKDLDSIGIKPDLIINAAGQVNPNASPNELLSLNFHLPKNLERYAHNHGVKLVTFGTVMENLEDLSRSNAYLNSKRLYFEYLAEKVTPDSESLHLQIHTWYGVAVPHRHMFLGQMFSALEKKELFKMSSGNQLREYHNIYDDIDAVQFLLSKNAKGVFEINHGETLSLVEIATSVFDFFKSRNLLKIGSLLTPEYEIIEKKFEPSKFLESVNFRATSQGIITDFQRLLVTQP